MTGLEIVLIIIGFACICISFFVSAKKNEEGQADLEGVQTSAIWSEKEEQMIRERIHEIMTECQTELVDDTEDQMSRLCNEKIMAIDEFSQQLLEKIENNHQEVVFMYNMLNEKEKDIKNVMAESVKVQPVAQPAPQQVAPSVSAVEMQKEPQTAIELMNARARKEKKVVKPKEPVLPVEPPIAEEPAVVQKEQKKEKTSGNVNLKIQKMYKEGKSVLDISKELNIGQGEVKLVIALYGGRK